MKIKHRKTKIDVIGANVAYTKNTIKYNTRPESILACSNSKGSANGRSPHHVVRRSSSVNLGPKIDLANAVATGVIRNSSKLKPTQVSTNKI